MGRDLEGRMLRLERRSRLALAAVGAAAALLLSGAAGAGSKTTLRTERLELVDGEGKVVAVLGAGRGEEQGASGLFLYDGSGGLRISLTHDAEQSALFVRDAAGTVRIGVAQFAHGGGGLALHGQESKGAAVLYYKTDGSLSFYGKDGSVALRIPEKQAP